LVAVGGRPTAWASQVAARPSEEKAFDRGGRGAAERGVRRSTGEVAARPSEAKAFCRRGRGASERGKGVLPARSRRA
jgi:hypothetical protein